MSDHPLGDARKTCHGNPVTLAGRTLLDVVQEDDASRVIFGGNVHVYDLRALRLQFGKFKVVRRKQRPAATGDGKFFGNGARQT